MYDCMRAEVVFIAPLENEKIMKTSLHSGIKKSQRGIQMDTIFSVSHLGYISLCPDRFRYVEQRGTFFKQIVFQNCTPKNRYFFVKNEEKKD